MTIITAIPPETSLPGRGSLAFAALLSAIVALLAGVAVTTVAERPDAIEVAPASFTIATEPMAA